VSAAAFNIVVNNVDEHARNFGFLQDDRGQWLSSPLFDAVPVNHEQDGTALEIGTPGRSLEQLLDLDWGLPKPLVVDIVTRVADSARHLYEVAAKQYGLDPEAAHNAERLRAAIAKV
jgi:serine/threonine-protein kinase HipA